MSQRSNDFLLQYSALALTTSLNMVFAAALELYQYEKILSPPYLIALMDTFRIHARALLFFFYGKNYQPDDAKAQDFMKNDREWSKLRRLQTEALLGLQKRVGKEVAHLTYSRHLDLNNPQDWDIVTELRDLNLVVQDFIENADPLKLHSMFRESPKKWQREIQRVIKRNTNHVQQNFI